MGNGVLRAVRVDGGRPTECGRGYVGVVRVVEVSWGTGDGRNTDVSTRHPRYSEHLPRANHAMMLKTVSSNDL